MYDRRKEIEVRKSAARAMMDKKYQEISDKNPPSRDEVICKNCGFKARYKFYRCPECNAEQKV
jgi:lipopolysaccharide biosynthesis regulator YciM